MSGVSHDHRAFAGLALLGALIAVSGWVARGWWEKRRRHDEITSGLIEQRARWKS